MQSNLFQTHVFLVYVLGATPHHVPLNHKCDDKKNIQIRVIHLIASSRGENKSLVISYTSIEMIRKIVVGCDQGLETTLNGPNSVGGSFEFGNDQCGPLRVF